MAKPSRAKGIGGEREVRRLLEDYGIAYQWNGYAAQRAPGATPDVETERYAIEVKRRREGTFQDAWWLQARIAADALLLTPAVVYRFVRKKWRIRTLMRLDHANKRLIADAAFEDWLEAAQKTIP